VKGVILVMAVVAFGLSAGSAEPLFTPMFGDDVVEIPQFGRLPTQPSWGFCRGRERIQPGISPLGLSSPKGTAARRRVLSLWDAERVPTPHAWSPCRPRWHLGAGRRRRSPGA
jgi:hypothetical protein